MIKMMRALVLVSLVVPAVSFAASRSQLTVTSTPIAQGSVAQGAQRVPVMRLTLTASCASDVTVSALSVSHAGLGDVADIQRLYATKGTTRISRAVAVRKDGPTRVPVRALTIAKCQSAELLVLADLSSTAASGGEHRFSMDSVETGSEVDVSITKENMPESSRVTPSSTSSLITAELLPVRTSVSYGAGRTVARLRMSKSGARDQRVHAVTFTNEGSASDADLRNLYLETTRGEAVSAVTDGMDGRTVRVEFDPPFLLDGTTILNLRADVRASRRKTIEWVIDEASDVEATEVRGR